IECFDISNIQGAASVGAMIVFENGRPKNSDYRRFRIKTVEGANDYASHQEMLRRRFKRGQPRAGQVQEAEDVALTEAAEAAELAQEYRGDGLERPEQVAE